MLDFPDQIFAQLVIFVVLLKEGGANLLFKVIAGIVGVNLSEEARAHFRSRHQNSLKASLPAEVVNVGKLGLKLGRKLLYNVSEALPEFAELITRVA